MQSTKILDLKIKNCVVYYSNKMKQFVILAPDDTPQNLYQQCESVPK